MSAQAAILEGQREELALRIHGNAGLPTLIHLPGLHGDWTLLGPFRSALRGQARLVEFSYPRRADWTLDDYARLVEERLLDGGITSGWVLGESFSSQVAWPLVARKRPANGRESFQPKGLILVGGFIRHPWPWGVRLACAASRAVPLWLLKRLCACYGRVASRRYCDSPDVLADLREFVQRRTCAEDRLTMNHRYRLLAECDHRDLAQGSHLPVFQLSGAMDPLVPWWQIRPWLRRHCPGYRASRIIWRGGHNVLLSAPAESAKQILAWIRQTPA